MQRFLENAGASLFSNSLSSNANVFTADVEAFFVPDKLAQEVSIKQKKFPYPYCELLFASQGDRNKNAVWYYHRSLVYADMVKSWHKAKMCERGMMPWRSETCKKRIIQLLQHVIEKDRDDHKSHIIPALCCVT